MSDAALQPPDALHVGVACVALNPWDRAAQPQCNIYIGGRPDTNVAFKITRADNEHSDYPLNSILFLAVDLFFFQEDLKLEKPPVELAVGKTYDLRLTKVVNSDGVHWDWELRPD